MLKELTLRNLGPAPELHFDFADRLNLLTGDNGLGKSFMLDVAWWCLTRRWPQEQNPRLTSGYPARPTDVKQEATISFVVDSKTTCVSYESTFDTAAQSWVGRPGRPWNPGLVIYAHADSGFSVWDPARNYWKTRGGIDVQERVPCYVFAPNDVWDGLASTQPSGRSSKLCNGLLADWAGWIREKGENARLMEAVIEQLSPDGEGVEVGPLVRLSVDDARDIPSISMAYTGQVPILHASSGIRRIVSLAYMLLWSWNEHLMASGLLGQHPTSQVVLLFDELECHLHPRWQRTILESLVNVVKELHQKAQIQLIAATHSPLILASAEPLFDEASDAWFDLDLEEERVVLRKRPFVGKGDVSFWLTSEAFDLKTARSLPAERGIEQALALLRQESPSPEEIARADKALREARLPDIDPFWVRWSAFVERNLGAGGILGRNGGA